MNDDRADLWRLVSEHRERLLRLARARTSSAEDAEDCVHEAMLRCVEYENLDVERLAPLLTTVTIRVCADRYRARQYGDRLRDRLSGYDAHAVSHEDDVCDRAEAAWLATKVDQLPPRQQALVRARAEGLSCAEVAARFRMSYDAVESQIARARSAIRSARISALGTLVPRWKLVAAGGVSVGAAVLVTVSPHLPHELERRPAAVAPHGSGVGEAPDAHHASKRRALATGVTIVADVAVPRVTSRVASPVAAVPAKRTDPRADADKLVTTPLGDLGTEEGDKKYTTPEKVWFCVKYGVELSSERWGCNYPPD